MDRPTMSASTASRATRLPWMSAISAIRMVPALRPNDLRASGDDSTLSDAAFRPPTG